MAGHVFVIRGDLTTLACDEWLVPTALSREIEEPWRTRLAGEGFEDLTGTTLPDGWQKGAVRSFCPDLTRAGRRPWLTNVGQHGASIDWYVAGARDFVVQAARALRPGTLNNRERPLLALPVVGTRLGGGRLHTGEILRALLEMMCQVTCDRSLPDYDTVLVTYHDTHFAAAQRQRRLLDMEGGYEVWGELGADLEGPAETLSCLANEGKLALFLGSGVSIGAGAPDWRGLLDQLALQAGIEGEELRQLRRLPEVDQAALVEVRIKDKAELKLAAAKVVHRDLASLTHTLLAGLPVKEVVTTNYDALFELASSCICEVSVLPHRPRPTAPRWILKLHGCVKDPESIVLTREDYLRYEQHRGALAGIVQALLITRSLLFVGFGLGDDNFHKIADEVRRAYPKGERFGFNVVIEDQDLQHELWKKDLDWISVGRGTENIAQAARRLEVFFDRVLAGVDRAPAHLLDPDFAAVLQPGEVKLGQALDSIISAVGDPEVQRDAPGAVREVMALLARLGRPGS